MPPSERQYSQNLFFILLLADCWLEKRFGCRGDANQAKTASASWASGRKIVGERTAGIPSRKDLAIVYTYLCMEKPLAQSIWDFIGFPFRAFLVNEHWQAKLGLTTMKEERLAMVLAHLEGRTLDIGCGDNRLVKDYRLRGGDGVGLDILKTPEVDVTVDSVRRLPFKDGEFDTVALVAALNHIPQGDRGALADELWRVLGADGRVVLTMISPAVGFWRHKLAYWDADQQHRDIDFMEEDYGMRIDDIDALFTRAGFTPDGRKRFVYGMNSLVLYRKTPSA